MDTSQKFGPLGFRVSRIGVRLDCLPECANPTLEFNHGGKMGFEKFDPQAEFLDEADRTAATTDQGLPQRATVTL
ncbi:unnamed protein product [marine sediment metagenome]|uniref:Uncharacterized protein n=1 Tax=marine sediment metagenome TaxID=412755 RepID=X0UE61_9ZZZZ